LDGTYDHIQRYASQSNGTCNETDKGCVVATVYMTVFSTGEKSPNHQSSQDDRNGGEDYHGVTVTANPRMLALNLHSTH
jgi:hypothetical protein